jgi:uridine phosphorylase
MSPKMFNHNRGLWGYTGLAADGLPLTVQATGMGGPSAAIVITELWQLGARTMIRVGTSGALQPSLELGDLLVADAALAADGTAQAIAGAGRVPGTPSLVEAVAAAAGPEVERGPVVSTDLFYDPAKPELEWARQGLLAVEMETATLFALAVRHGFSAGALLLVSDLVIPERRRIDSQALLGAEAWLGEVAFAALNGGYASPAVPPAGAADAPAATPDASSRSSAASIDASR